MKRAIRWLGGVLAAFGLVTFSSTAWAHDSSCPDVRASQVDGRVDKIGSKRCGFGFRIFGIGGGLFGPQCPDKIFTYPSHQECKGEPSPGTRCEPAGELQVRAQECRCASATFLGTGLLFPSCDCRDTNDGGHVEDARTVACRGGPIGDPPPEF